MRLQISLGNKMAMLNTYRTTCIYCAEVVQPKQGYLQRSGGHWHANCFDCYKRRNDQKYWANKEAERLFRKMQDGARKPNEK